MSIKFVPPFLSIPVFLHIVYMYCYIHIPAGRDRGSGREGGGTCIYPTLPMSCPPTLPLPARTEALFSHSCILFSPPSSPPSSPPLPHISHDMLKSATDRMKSWVMVSPQSSEPFVKLPNERILYRSPIRTSLTLSSPPNTHSSIQPWSVSSDGGVAYITNQRVCPPPSSPGVPR